MKSIVIDREYGSGGREVAKILSEKQMICSLEMRWYEVKVRNNVYSKQSLTFLKPQRARLLESKHPKYLCRKSS